MAGNIKGITIEIGGNVSPLNKALDGVNNKSKDLQSELKQVERLLKLDPGNTTLLAQKQELLAKSVGNTKDKLDTLKEAEKQVQAQFKKGEVSEEQYRDLQREIVQTEAKLSSMKSEAIKANAVLSKDEATENLKKIGDTAMGTAKMVTGTTAAVAGASILATQGYEEALNTLKTKTGLVNNETSGFEETLKNLYAGNYGEGYSDIAEAMAEITQQTGQTGKALENTTRNALILKDTFGFEVVESTRSANMMMNQFGYTSEEAFDLIAQGAQNGLDKNGDMLDSINEYSVHFKQLGMDGEDMFSALKAGAASGAFSVDKVGDAFKEFGIRVKDGSDASKGAFESMGLDAEKMTKAFSLGGEDAKNAYTKVADALAGMKDPVEQNAAGVALFGTMWEDMGSKATLAAMGATNGFSKSRETMEEINKVKYDTPLQQLQSIGKTLQVELLLPLGEKLMPILNKIIEKLPAIINSIKQIPQWIEKNSTTLTLLGIAIGTIITLIIAFNIQQALMASGMTLWTAIGAGATAVTTALATAMAFLTSPIALVILAIGAVIAVGVLLYKNWDTIKEKATEIFGYVGDFVGGAIEKIRGFFSGVIDFVKNNWQGILLFIVNPFAGAFKLLYDNLDGFRNKVDSIFTGVKDFIGGAIEKIKGFFSFDWELPKIKLPHFDIKGKFSLSPPQIPKLDVDWYDKGGIFNTPSIIGVGEKRPEFVGALDDLRYLIRDEMKKNNGNSTGAITVLVNSILDGNIVAKSVNKVNLRNDRRYNP